MQHQQQVRKMEDIYLLNQDCISCLLHPKIHFIISTCSKILSKLIYTISRIEFSCRRKELFLSLHKFRKLTHLHILNCVAHSHNQNCSIFSYFHQYVQNYFSKFNCHPSLKSLRLDAMFTNIPSLLNLEKLNALSCIIKLKEINKFERLTYLKFFVSEENVLNELMCLSNLKVLHVEGEEYVNEELFIANHEMHTKFTNLHKLIIKMNYQEYSNVKNISIDFPNLTSLHMDMNKHGYATLSVLFKCTKLIQLSIEGVITEDLSDYLKTTSCLTKLHLKNCYNSPYDLNLSINYTPRLKYLHLINFEEVTLDRLPLKTNLLENVQNCKMYNE